MNQGGAMIHLSLSLALYSLIVILTAFLIPDIGLKNGFHLIPAVLLGGLLNFILAPVLTGMGLKLTLLTLGIFSFIINFLILNISMGLIDDFGIRSWESAFFGSILYSFLQILLNSRDPDRRSLLS